MIVDVLISVVMFAAIFRGYKKGFLQTIFSTIGYIGGGVLGLALALRYADSLTSAVTKFLIAVLAIFIGAGIGQGILGSLAKVFRTKILWGPLRFIDSLLGVFLEALKAVLLLYLLLSLVAWSPWAGVSSAVKESKIYPRFSAQLPDAVTQLRTEIEKKFSINLPK